MSDHATEIDVEGALEALNTEHGAEGAAPVENTPVTEAPAPDVVEAPAEETPAPEATAEETVEESPYTHIPDESLSPELLTMKRALQADYTRKMQEAAPWRKLAEEYEVEGPDDLREALDSYNQLSDPANWPQLHTELSQYLQSQGLSVKEADAVAGAELSAAVQPSISAEDFDEDDADYIPPALQRRMDQMEQSQRQLTEVIAGERQRAAMEAQLVERANKLTKQELEIRKAHADWDDEDISAIYDLMGDSGDLNAAATRFESLIGGRLAKYIARKGAALEAPTPVPGAGVIAAEEAERPKTLEEAHDAAMASLAARDRQNAGGTGY